MKPALNVAITGAAGQIGYALAFRVASGQMLGPDQPVNLHLLEITPALPALQGVVMELNDCAFPTINKIVATDDAKVAFRDCNFAMLVGAPFVKAEATKYTEVGYVGRDVEGLVRDLVEAAISLVRSS